MCRDNCVPGVVPSCPEPHWAAPLWQGFGLTLSKLGFGSDAGALSQWDLAVGSIAVSSHSSLLSPSSPAADVCYKKEGKKK